MQINNILNINNKNNLNFRSVSLVQIPRKAFANPENIKECSKYFGKALDKATKDKLSGTLGSIIAFLFSSKHQKTAYMLENTSYYMAKNAMLNNGYDYSIFWLAQNTDLPVKDVIDKDYHSFYVFTKEHKAGFINAYKSVFKDLFDFSKEGLRKYSTDSKMAAIYTQVKTGVKIDKNIASMLGDEQVKVFKLNNVNQVKDIVKDLNV